MDLLSGTMIDKYKVERRLGAGGMADVFAATDTALGRSVAIKVLPPEFARDPERLSRFDKEVRACAALSHANIVQVYDVGEFNYDSLTLKYYTMALLPGGDLKQKIAQGLTHTQSLRILRQMAGALAYAHKKGFIHRDIKPENILFDESGEAVLTDLGIAKAIGSGTQMTKTGMSIGTPHYMSPEQARGLELDGRSDLYSLGVVFFEMLTGQVPYAAADTFAVAYSHINDPLPQLPGTLQSCQPLLDKLLAKQPKDRYRDGAALVHDIDRLLAGETLAIVQATRQIPVNRPEAPANTAKYTSSRQSGNHGLKWGLGGAALAAVLGVVLVQSGAFDNSPAQRPTGGSSGAAVSGAPGSTAQPSTAIISEAGGTVAAESERQRQAQAQQATQYVGEMITIPAGSFRMGSASGGDNDERPVRTVNVRSFRLGKHEVTFAQWDACVADGGCSHRPDDRGWGRGNRPVINVSYNDITQQFIPWLNRRTGQSFRLPTETEWEYAARAGTTTNYPWGDSIGRNNANCYSCGSQWDNSQTAPVGSFSANRFGLHDMHGNVWEWVQDCWNGSYNGAPTNGSAWMQGDCSRAVLRGGSWSSSPDGVRSANRVGNGRAARNSNYGFRLAQDI